MPYQENEQFANRYKLIQKLGVGGFSEVWLASDDLTDGGQVAIKIYAPNGGLDNQGLKVFSKEYALLQDINNQYLLKAMHFDIANDMPYLILPYCPNGSLLGQLHDKGNFTEEELAKVIFEVCTGLAHLHDNGIIHQDIKPANILINRRNEYLISDFGISNNVRRTLRKSMGVTSSSMSPEYAPPERFSSNPRTIPAGDVFSFGVLMYEMATGDVPWMGMGGMSLSRGAEVPNMPENFSNLFKKWAIACLALEPENRPKAADLAKAANTFINEGFWPPYKQEGKPAVKPKAGGRKTVAQVDMSQMAAQIDENLKAEKEEKTVAKQKPKAGAATIKDGGTKPKPAKKKKKSPVLAIVIAIIVIGGAAVGLWWFNKQQKEKYYTDLLNDAASYELDSNWLEASFAFREATALRPSDTIGTNGLERVTDQIQSIINEVIAQADKLAEDKKYIAALETLEKIDEYKATFSDVDEAKEKYEALAQKQKEEEFNKLLALGDKYLSALTYAKAAEYFGRADSIMPGDARVQEKLTSIGGKLKELYSGEILKGDKNMLLKNHAAAVSAYSRAILYDKSNADAKAKLAKAKTALDNDKKLFAAAEKGDLSGLNSAISAGANVNYKDANSVSCFAIATKSGDVAVVRALKNAGATCDISTAINYDYSAGYLDPVENAAKFGYLELLKYLKTTCGASMSGLYEITSNTAVKDYLKSLGYGTLEYADYFSSESSSYFATNKTENREWTYRDSKFYARCLTEGYGGWTGAAFDDIDLSGNWEVSVDMHHVSGNTGNGGVGLHFGTKSDYSYVNVFGVTPSGKYHIGNYGNSEWNTEYIETTNVKTGNETNNLKVVKKGTTMYYYINGTYITSKYGVTMAGSDFGFYYGSSEGYTTVWFDNFKLKEN